jgi:hypothetical protein
VVPDDHDIQRFEDLLQAFEHAMLRFATSNRSAKAAEVAMDPRVSVVMQGNGAYLAISGHGKFFFC